MSLKEKIQAIRNPEFRSNVVDFDHPAGLITEEEIMKVVGGAEVNPNSLITRWKCPSLSCPTVAECLLTRANACPPIEI